MTALKTILLVMSTAMCMKVVRAAKALSTSRIMAHVGTFTSMHQHVSFEMFITLETPSTKSIFAHVLMLYSRSISRRANTWL